MEPNTQTALAVIPAELQAAVLDTGLALEVVNSLRDAFTPHFVKFHELATEAKTIAVNAPKAARAMRLQLRAVRVAADKTRADLKAESLHRGRAIDRINAVLDEHLSPIEAALGKIERAEEIAEAERKAALVVERSAALAPFGYSSEFYDLGAMPAPKFEQLLAGAKAAHEAKLAADARAEADRIERERREALGSSRREQLKPFGHLAASGDLGALTEAEFSAKLDEWTAAAAIAKAEREAEAYRIEAQRVENARLKAELRRRAEELAFAERVERERRDREERERQAKADAELAEVQRKARVEREAAEAAAAIEREKREKAEAELRAKEAAEAKARAAAARAAKRLAAEPDRKKLERFAVLLSPPEMPALSTDEAKAIGAEVARRLFVLAEWIHAETNKL